MAKQPKIRFKGFTEGWKYTSFKEIAVPIPYKQYIKIPETNGKYPIIQQGDNPILGYANGDPIKEYHNIVVFGDHTVSVFKPKTPFFAATDGIRIFNIEQFPQPFSFALFEKYKPKQLGYTRHTLALYESIAHFPSGSNEQLCIGEFFDTFDTTISQRETELEKLRNIKRALLEKLFPQDGQSTPAIRFKGFEGKWEPKVLGDEIEETGTKNRNNLPLESYSITNEAGFMPQTEKFENGGYVTEANKTLYTIVPPKSFAYNPARINVGSIGYYNGTKDVIVSSLYIVFKTSEAIHDDFLMAWFKSDIFNHLIYKLQEGGVRQYFFYDKIVQCPILLPKNPEQEKIAKLVNSLNKTISLRERQLTLLKHSKQALLEQMFVNS